MAIINDVFAPFMCNLKKNGGAGGWIAPGTCVPLGDGTVACSPSTNITDPNYAFIGKDKNGNNVYSRNKGGKNYWVSL